MELSYISGKGNPKKLSGISGINFLSPKNKKNTLLKFSYISRNGTF